MELEPQSVRYFDSVFVREGGRDFVYNMFHALLAEFPEIKINPEEHQDFAWVTPQEALNMDLVHDLDECIRLYYNI